jgi:hypothetical protein
MHPTAVASDDSLAAWASNSGVVDQSATRLHYQNQLTRVALLIGPGFFEPLGMLVFSRTWEGDFADEREAVFG